MAQNSGMTEKEYLLLCSYCDRILNERRGTITSTAIPSLHIIREHPILLKRYSLFIRSNIVDRAKQIIKIFSAWVRIVRFSFFKVDRFWYSSVENQNEIDCLFVSHLLNEDYDKQSGDFYYDRLPYMIQQDGYKSAIALINHTKHEKPIFFESLNKRKISFYLFTKHLSLRTELSFLFKIITEAIQIRKIKATTTDLVFKKVINSAIYDAFSDNAVNSLRVHTQIVEFVKIYKPKVVITTYEGHGWERLSFAAARLSNPSVKCIAYQHSAIFKFQHAIKKSLGLRYDPDIILCSGIVGKNQLEKSAHIKHIPKFVLGSNRTININGSFEKEDFFKLNANETSQSCLVLPEGDIDECNLLFEFSIECAKQFAHVKFIWRLHPLVTFEQLIKCNQKLKNLPENIVLSKETLASDIERCNSALYRGTTAIIPAVYKGLKPLYLAMDGEMTIDPLHEINDISNYVYNVNDFRKILNLGMTWNEYLLVKDYCTKIFQPLDYNKLKQQLQELN